MFCYIIYLACNVQNTCLQFHIYFSIDVARVPLTQIMPEALPFIRQSTSPPPRRTTSTASSRNTAQSAHMLSTIEAYVDQLARVRSLQSDNINATTSDQRPSAPPEASVATVAVAASIAASGPQTLIVSLPQEESLADPYANASAPPSYDEVTMLPPCYDEAALPSYNEAVKNQMYMQKVDL